MTEPCHRHSRADSALHGDECAQCLRADLAVLVKERMELGGKVWTLEADLAAARAEVARLRDVLKNFLTVEEINTIMDGYARIREALAATAKP